MSWTPKAIFTRRGQKTPQALVPGLGRENITVQTCISASGQLLPPYVVYKGARLRAETTFGGPLGTRFSVSHNGWMTADGFVDWLKSQFIPALPPARPVLLLLDGHSSHIGYDVRQLAIDNDIHLLKLPPHTTHLLQPLDVGFFNCMKHAWQEAIGDFTRKEHRVVTKCDFPALLKLAWDKCHPKWAEGGFKNAGVVPFNPSAISTTSLAPAQSFLSDFEQVHEDSEEEEEEEEEGGGGGGQEEEEEGGGGGEREQEEGGGGGEGGQEEEEDEEGEGEREREGGGGEGGQEEEEEGGGGRGGGGREEGGRRGREEKEDEEELTQSSPGLQPYLPSSELRDFFAELISRTSAEKVTIPGSRRRLVGHGESLTCEEAMERVRAAEEEKRKEEQEKAEKAAERKRKREEREQDKVEKAAERKREREEREQDKAKKAAERTRKREEREEKRTKKLEPRREKRKK